MDQRRRTKGHEARKAMKNQDPVGERKKQSSCKRRRGSFHAFHGTIQCIAHLFHQSCFDQYGLLSDGVCNHPETKHAEENCKQRASSGKWFVYADQRTWAVRWANFNSAIRQAIFRLVERELSEEHFVGSDAVLDNLRIVISSPVEIADGNGSVTRGPCRPLEYLGTCHDSIMPDGVRLSRARGENHEAAENPGDRYQKDRHCTQDGVPCVRSQPKEASV